MDSKLESVIVSVQANVAQTAFSATTETKKRVVNSRQNDGGVAGVGKIVGRPSKNLPLGHAGHKQVLS